MCLELTGKTIHQTVLPSKAERYVGRFWQQKIWPKCVLKVHKSENG